MYKPPLIKSVVHNRWFILAIACFINLCVGSTYAWSVFATPLAQELNVESTSIVFSITNSVGFITMIIGGILNDKYGPKWVVFLGGLLFGGGMFLTGFAGSLRDACMSYGVLLGLGLSLVYGCTISNTIKFFPDHRGLVGGLTTASYGISSVVLAGIVNSLNERFGVRYSFKILGIVFLIVICSCSLLLKRYSGDAAHGKDGCSPEESAGLVAFTPQQMIRTREFYVMMLMLTCGATFGMMIISSASSLVVNVFFVNMTKASLLVSALCLANTIGRIASGIISDYFGRLRTLCMAYFIAATALIVMIFSELHMDIVFYIAGIIAIGMCFGTFMGVFPGFCTDHFGQAHNTINYGIMWIGFSIGGILGPMIVSRVYSCNGTYTVAFFIAFFLSVIGLIMTYVYRKTAK